MKKFLEELAKAKQLHDVEVSEVTAEATEKFMAMKKEFDKLKGARGLLKLRRSESRVVTIQEAYLTYVRVTYKYTGKDYDGELSTCLDYGSLLCGDAQLEVKR